MNKYVTPNGKEISTTICPRTAHVKIQFTSGGELPEELSGLFTSVRMANVAIEAYIKRQEQKRSKDKE